ncbi:MAG: nucleotidyl transferase AbiEii/AbiGii toxin family protein [Acidimicrobiales bacterium]
MRSCGPPSVPPAFSCRWPQARSDRSRLRHGRRPTRDIGFQAQALDNDPENVRAVICEVAARRADDGVVFDVDGATAAVIREEDAYGGVRVTMNAELATARPHFHVDVNGSGVEQRSQRS